MNRGTETETADVAVVGYGPVGMVTAALLGRAGHRVVVLERYPGKYNLPRAAIFDDETMRTLAVLGVAEELSPKVHVQRNYEWRNGAGDLLLEHDFAGTGRSGWAEWYMMYQPDLEDALDRVCRSMHQVQVRHSSPVTGIEQSGDEVTVTVDQRHTVRARYVVACDGGNSLVRRALGVGQEDLGFSEPWLVCDFRLRRPVSVPAAMQLGDPHQPTSIISLGPSHHRFSFMLNSAQDFETERDSAKVWARVARWLSPADADLVRVAAYTFRSLLASDWRRGRVLLAGDAAHQMPPFLGQGMCSGIRDAQNLAFKLGLVLGDGAGTDLLDTYQREREPHVRAVIEKGIELGRMQTIRDPELAAARDRELLARRAEQPAPENIRFPGLREGLLASSSGPGRGDLSIQGVVTDGVRRDRLDQLVGAGFCLLVQPAALGAITDSATAALQRAGVRVVSPGAHAGSHGPAQLLVDVDGAYQAWFAQLGSSAILVRPDFYVYGTAVDGPGLERLALELLHDIGAARSPAAGHDVALNAGSE